MFDQSILSNLWMTHLLHITYWYFDPNFVLWSTLFLPQLLPFLQKLQVPPQVLGQSILIWILGQCGHLGGCLIPWSHSIETHLNHLPSTFSPTEVNVKWVVKKYITCFLKCILQTLGNNAKEAKLKCDIVNTVAERESRLISHSLIHLQAAFPSSAAVHTGRP